MSKVVLTALLTAAADLAVPDASLRALIGSVVRLDVQRA